MINYDRQIDIKYRQLKLIEVNQKKRFISLEMPQKSNNYIHSKHTYKGPREILRLRTGRRIKREIERMQNNEEDKKKKTKTLENT